MFNIVRTFVVLFLLGSLYGCFEVKLSRVDTSKLSKDELVKYSKLDKLIELNKSLNDIENKKNNLDSNYGVLKSQLDYYKLQKLLDNLQSSQEVYNYLFNSTVVSMNMKINTNNPYYNLHNDFWFKVITADFSITKVNNTCIIKIDGVNFGIDFNKDILECKESVKNIIIQDDYKTNTILLNNNMEEGEGGQYIQTEITYKQYKFITSYTQTQLDFVNYVKDIYFNNINNDLIQTYYINEMLLGDEVVKYNLNKYLNLSASYKSHAKFISDYNNFYNLLTSQISLYNSIEEAYTNMSNTLNQGIISQRDMVNDYKKEALSGFIDNKSFQSLFLTTYDSQLLCDDDVCLETKKNKFNNTIEYNTMHKELVFDKVATISFIVFFPITVPISVIVYLTTLQNPFILTQ